MSHDFNVLALIKGPERFVFVYDDQSRDRLIDELRERAADPQCNLTWFDAVVLTQKAREDADEETFTLQPTTDDGERPLSWYEQHPGDE